MINFEYTGLSEGKYVSGDIEAVNTQEAEYKLKEQKIIITKLVKLKKKDKSLAKKNSFSLSKKIPTKEVLLFTKQLATMIKAGLRALESLQLLESQLQHKAMKDVVSKIIKDLESGNDLSQCFAKHPKVFDTIYVNLIKAGEASGKLDNFLEKIVVALEKREKIRSKIKGALTYPAVLFFVAMSVTAIMLIFIMPKFTKMYEDMNAEIPGATLVIQGISEFIRSPLHGGITFIILVILIYGYNHLIKNNYNVRKNWHKFIFKIPILGVLIQKSILARVSLVLGNLRGAGVEILESIDIAQSVTTNLVVVEALENVKKGVFSGKGMGEFIAKEKIFPSTFHQLISVGEQTGNLDEMLNSVAKYYEEEFDEAVANLATLIEPIMICFMGVLIGGLLLAMYLPILSIGGAIG